MTAHKNMGCAVILRGFFVVLMSATGIAKLLDMQGFISVVASYRTLPFVLLAPSAWALALTEVALAVWLAWGRWLYAAALLLMALHLMYLAWLLLALARGMQLDNCGCFGVYLAQPLTWYSPLEDAVLLSLAFLLWRGARKAGYDEALVH